MNIYCIYTNLNKKQTEPVIVNQGFSFYGAFFSFLWALYHKMWIIAFTLPIITTFLRPMLEKSHLHYLFDISVLFIFGFFASDLRAYYLINSGFKLDEIIIAQNEEAAELKYYYKIKNQN